MKHAHLLLRRAAAAALALALWLGAALPALAETPGDRAAKTQQLFAQLDALSACLEKADDPYAETCDGLSAAYEAFLALRETQETDAPPQDTLLLARAGGRLAICFAQAALYAPTADAAQEYGYTIQHLRVDVLPTLYGDYLAAAGLPADWAEQDATILLTLLQGPLNTENQRRPISALVRQLLANDADGSFARWYAENYAYFDPAACIRVPLALNGISGSVASCAIRLADGSWGVPLALFLTDLGADVSVSDDDAVVTAQLYGESYRFTIGDPTALLGAAGQQTLDWPPVPQGDILCLTVAQVADIFGLTLQDRLQESDPCIDLTQPARAALTQAQADFLVGLAAPINLHNAYTGGGLLPGQSLSEEDWQMLCAVPLDPLAGPQPGAENAIRFRQTLANSWSVTDRESLEAQIEALLTGGHRKTMRSWRDSGTLPQWFTQKWGERVFAPQAFLAWDLARAVQLAQWGCCTGYLDPDTALADMLVAVQGLQANYTSWADFAQDYLMGYDLFIGEDAEQSAGYWPRPQLVALCYQSGRYGTAGWDVDFSPLAQQYPTDLRIQNATARAGLGAGSALLLALANWLCTGLTAAILAVCLRCNQRKPGWQPSPAVPGLPTPARSDLPLGLGIAAVLTAPLVLPGVGLGVAAIAVNEQRNQSVFGPGRDAAALALGMAGLICSAVWLLFFLSLLA